MKLVWCPESAAKAYIDAVKAFADRSELEDTNVAELVAAMAGGWRAQLIVEAWCCEGDAATAISLATATRHTGGAHVCVVEDERVRQEYMQAVEHAGATPGKVKVMVGDAEEAMREVEGVDFMVVDLRRKDAASVLREARPGNRGMVVVCRNATGRGGGGAARMIGRGTRVVRTVLLPMGSGLEILHVGVGKGPGVQGGCSRWVKLVDRETGEEHVFRR